MYRWLASQRAVMPPRARSQKVGNLHFTHLAGYVALLLWGMHMVHTGIIRAFGGHLRQRLPSASPRFCF